MNPDDRWRDGWLRRSGLPERIRDQRLRTMSWGPDADHQVDDWLHAVLDGRVVAAPHEPGSCGLGLLLYGQPGHGKSTLARLLAQEIILNAPRSVFVPPGLRRPVYFDRFDQLLERQRILFNPGIVSEEVFTASNEIAMGSTGIERDWTISVLVIDDLGKENRTEWTRSKIESLLRIRYDQMLPTIITTNVTPDELGEMFSPSLASFAHEAMIHVPIISSTGDRRRRR